jgi:hypothetical protein
MFIRDGAFARDKLGLEPIMVKQWLQRNSPRTGSFRPIRRKKGCAKARAV